MIFFSQGVVDLVRMEAVFFDAIGKGFATRQVQFFFGDAGVDWKGGRRRDCVSFFDANGKGFAIRQV